MTYADALRHFAGNASALARALGVRPVSVLNWGKRGHIPDLRQYQLEELTAGKLKREQSPQSVRT